MDQCFIKYTYAFPAQQSQSIINIEMRSYNSGTTTTKRNTTSATGTPFCKVCSDAGLPADKYKSHYVKDQPGPNGKVVCPTLLSQKCLICGVPGHTTRYCSDNPDNSSTTSSTVSDRGPRYANAADDIRDICSYLPAIQQRAPIQRPVQRSAPHIVYETKNEFPVLPGRFNASARFHNDEPLQKRGPAESADFETQASPVHSPVEQKFTKVKYNKRNNPFDALQNHQSDSEDEKPKQQKQQPKKIQQLPPITTSSSSSSSWASIAALAKTTTTTTTTTTTQQPQRSRSRFSIVVPTAVSGLPPSPIVFKARPPCPIVFKARAAPASASGAEKKEQVKKLWGDTDSEDDEEFLKRGLDLGC